MTQPISLSLAQSQVMMGASKRVKVIEVQEGHARDRALASLTF